MSSFPDARTLLVVVLIITSLAIAMDDPLWLAGLLISTLAILLWLGVSPRRLGGRLRRYRWLFLILALVQSLTNPAGQIYLEWRDYVLLSSGGLLAALAVLLRLATILAAALALTIRNYQELTIALVQLGVPYELAYMVLLAVRFIPVFMDEFRQSLLAIQLRGVDLGQIPLAEKVRVYSYILMPAVAGAIIRARRIATAMEARAFRAKKKRTWLEWPRLSAGDWLILVGAVLGGAVCATIYWGWL
ncbi:MAG: energy-coupling factor transporter transmembrane component T family protein [Bacillota bacterium]|jgi:energy-coupling factor transport system permease protein